MKKHMLRIVVVIFGVAWLSSANAQRYPITVGAYPDSATIPKPVWLVSVGIAEGVDDFGFEIVLRGKNIVSYSCVLGLGDSVLFSANNIKGFRFPQPLLQQVKKNEGLLTIRFSDIALKTDTLKQQAENRKLLYFIH